MSETDSTREAETPRDLLDQGLRGQRRMAHRFVQRYRGRLIYTEGRGWLSWNGSYWEPCDDAIPWRGVGRICREALTDLKTLEDRDRDNLYKDIRSCDSESGTKGVLAHVSRSAGIRVKDTDLNGKSNLFVFRNGTFDLDTGEFRDSQPEDYMTLAAGCDYDPAATCPLYDQLMETYQPDPEIRDYLHTLAGAAMEGKQNLQNLITWYGATGGNGKGTTMRAWQIVFGTFCKMLPVEALTSKGRDDSYRDQKAQLQGVRMVFATEPDEGSRFNTGTVKALTGGDRIVTRAMYKSTVEFDPTWLIIMATNVRVSTPNDGGMARRLKEIPWQFTVEPGNMRSDLDDKLAAEASGIANRLLEGWWSYKSLGIEHPAKIEEATREYLEEVDPVARFLEECTERAEGVMTQSNKLYQLYKNWCEDEGQGAYSNARFSMNLARRGMEKKKTGGVMMWINLSTLGT